MLLQAALALASIGASRRRHATPRRPQPATLTSTSVGFPIHRYTSSGRNGSGTSPTSSATTPSTGYRLPGADATRYQRIVRQLRRHASAVLGLDLAVVDDRLQLFHGIAELFGCADQIDRLRGY